MAEITARGNIPLLVGGTMLYFKALRQGLNDLPQADPAIRASIDAMAAESGWPAVHAELARLDPATAARLNPADAQRIQRAMEVCILSGQTMSSLLEKDAVADLPYRVHALALLPGDRAVLHQRIAQRFDVMLAQGLIEEVELLRRNYELNLPMPSMRCVGYRQTWQYLDGEFDLPVLREKGIAATRQLAKRQLTWLRGMEGIIPFDCLERNLPAAVFDWLRRRL
jgi:tRNA dimethylallyltransferase